MNRDNPAKPINNEYTDIASPYSQPHFRYITNSVIPGAKYKNLLSLAMADITKKVLPVLD